MTNLLLLFCDQLRADVLGCYGHPFAVTPAMDGLAARGTVYDRAYTPSPVCVSARASLVFGAEPGETGCYDNGYAMPVDRPTLMGALSDAGYRTHGVGKMHFTPDPYAPWGFQTRDIGEEFGSVEDDHYLQFLADRGWGHVERPHGLREEMYYVPQLSPVPEPLHYSRWVADRSIEFLRTRQAGEPFFLWSSFIHPHPPFAPPSPWHRLYRPALMPPPRRVPGEASLMTVHNLKQNRYKYRDGGEDRRLLQLIQAYYLACVSFVDAQIARILAQVPEDTVVVLAADHGEFLGDYGYFGKRSFLDAAARIPLVVAGPGVPPGERSGQLASLVDIAPTLLAAAGVTPVAAPLPRQRRETLFGQLQSGGAALYLAMTRRWKYVYSAADEREYLIDKARDPGETTNVAYNAHCRDALLAMRERAAGHFPDLAGGGFDTANAPFALGGPDEAETLAVIARDPDGGFLTMPDDDLAPDETFAEYRTRHREGENA